MAIDLLRQNIDNINWYNLSRNPNAHLILKDYPNKVYWPYILENPCIFQYDYDYMKENMNLIREELMKTCFHPKRLLYYLEHYNYDIGIEEYI
jgi:hypothetical protein